MGGLQVCMILGGGWGRKLQWVQESKLEGVIFRLSRVSFFGRVWTKKKLKLEREEWFWFIARNFK